MMLLFSPSIAGEVVVHSIQLVTSFITCPFDQNRFFVALQHTFNSQFAQRYQNVRRESKRVAAPKIVLTQASVHHQPAFQEDSETDYNENVKALAMLMNSKNPPAAQAVMELLDATRSKRTSWMKSEISIGQIMEEYPCFKSSKWVSHFPMQHIAKQYTLPFLLNKYQVRTTINFLY